METEGKEKGFWNGREGREGEKVMVWRVCMCGKGRGREGVLEWEGKKEMEGRNGGEGLYMWEMGGRKGVLDGREGKEWKTREGSRN